MFKFQVYGLQFVISSYRRFEDLIQFISISGTTTTNVTVTITITMSLAASCSHYSCHIPHLVCKSNEFNDDMKRTCLDDLTQLARLLDSYDSMNL